MNSEHALCKALGEYYSIRDNKNTAHEVTKLEAIAHYMKGKDFNYQEIYNAVIADNSPEYKQAPDLAKIRWHIDGARVRNVSREREYTDGEYRCRKCNGKGVLIERHPYVADATYMITCDICQGKGKGPHSSDNKWVSWVSAEEAKEVLKGLGI